MTRNHRKLQGGSRGRKCVEEGGVVGSVLRREKGWEVSKGGGSGSVLRREEGQKAC